MATLQAAVASCVRKETLLYKRDVSTLTDANAKLQSDNKKYERFLRNKIPLDIDLKEDHQTGVYDLSSHDGIRDFCSYHLPSLRKACDEVMGLEAVVCVDGLPAVPLSREHTVEDVYSFLSKILTGVTTKGKRIPVFSDHIEKGTKLRNGKSELTIVEKIFGLCPTHLEDASPHIKAALLRHWCSSSLTRLGDTNDDTEVDKIGTRNWLTTKANGSTKQDTKGVAAFISLVSVFYEPRSAQEVRSLVSISRLAEGCVHTISTNEVHVLNPTMSTWSAKKDLRFGNFTPARCVMLWVDFISQCLITPALHTVHIRSPTRLTTYEDEEVLIEHAQKSLQKFMAWQTIKVRWETLMLAAVDKIRGSNQPLVGTIFAIFKKFICRFVIDKHDWDSRAILMLESLINENMRDPVNFYMNMRESYMLNLDDVELRTQREHKKTDLPAIGNDVEPPSFEKLPSNAGVSYAADLPSTPRKNARANQRPAPIMQCIPISSKDDAKHADWWKLYSQNQLPKLLPSSLKKTCDGCNLVKKCTYCFVENLIADLHSLAHCAAPLRPVEKTGSRGSGAVLVGGAVLSIPLSNKILSKKNWTQQVCPC